MRVLHLVTLVSTDGAFGGPLRVAMNQAAELRARGHQVEIAAGWREAAAPPTDLEGTPARLFRSTALVPPLGFSGLVSPPMLRWLRRHARQFDLVHVHAGRDLTTVSAMAVLASLHVPYVTQTHGMVPPDDRAMARVLDGVLVRRLLRRARARLVLTAREEEELRALLGPSTPLDRVMNGVSLPAVVPPRPRHAVPQVLFCARLHPRKRPVVFVEVAKALLDRGVTADFALVGPDEGELPAVLARIHDLGLEQAVRYEGALPYDQVPARLAAADVYVLPSVDEPFPMSLLEALSLGVPSVCTDSFGVADLLRTTGAAVVSAPDVPSLAEAVVSALEPGRSQALTDAALAASAEHFGISAVADRLETLYQRGVHSS